VYGDDVLISIVDAGGDGVAIGSAAVDGDDSDMNTMSLLSAATGIPQSPQKATPIPSILAPQSPQKAIALLSSFKTIATSVIQ